MSNNCGGCSGKLGKKGYKIQCNDCKSWYHENCTDATEEEIKKIKSKKLKWMCGDCTGENGDSDTEDAEADSDVEEEMIPIISPSKMKHKNKITLEDLYDLINKLVSQNGKLIKKIKVQERETKELRKEVKWLKEEQTRTKKEFDRLNEEKSYQKQDKLGNNLVVCGVSVDGKSKDELRRMVLDIGKKLNVNIEEKDVDCVPIGREENKRLKVILSRKELKDEIMKAKKNVSLNTKDLGQQDSKTVYINHDLTWENQLLFSKVRAAKARLKYKYAWFSRGKIWIRKTDTAKPIHIESEKTLQNLLKDQP